MIFSVSWWWRQAILKMSSFSIGRKLFNDEHSEHLPPILKHFGALLLTNIFDPQLHDRWNYHVLTTRQVARVMLHHLAYFRKCRVLISIFKVNAIEFAFVPTFRVHCHFSICSKSTFFPFLTSSQSKKIKA